MTTSVAAITSRLRHLTLDLAGVRWTDAELVLWLNDGQVEIATNKPTASTVAGPIPLIEGVRQAIPETGIALLDITHNNVSGLICTLIKRIDLDSSLPTWPGIAPTVDVEHYMVDDEDPRSFLVYPPNTGTGVLRGRYTTLPAVIADETGDITLAGEYIVILLDYLLYRVWTKHNSNPNAAAYAKEAYNRFLRALGVKLQAEITYSPRRNQEDNTNGSSTV